MTIVYVLVLTVLSSILYRLGGASKEDQDAEFPWIPRWFKNIPKKRDIGCNLCTLLAVGVAVGFNAPWWAWVVAFGLTWASLSTYWDFLFKYDNHWFHGFMIGFSLIVFLTVVPWYLILARSVVLAVLMGVWSLLIGDAKWEEMGRGFVMPITVLLLTL